MLARPIVAILSLSLLAVCSPILSAQEPPVPPVGVIELKAKDVPVVRELPGRIAATRISEVRSRVSGILQERVFEQGSFVKEGEVLYRIDPKIFRVRVASAKAQLKKAEATRDNAKRHAERLKDLFAKNAASRVDYDLAVVSFSQADADVDLAVAMLDEAEINLDYTEIRAPISGVIGAALVTEGALVTAEGPNSLALIQQVDPVYADFTQSAQELLALERAVEDGKLASRAPDEVRVELVFDDGSVYPEAGRLLFASASVDATTGQVTMRAEFPNPKRHLLPGMYVRIRIEQAIKQNAVVVPQRAVLRSEGGGANVFVLDKDNVARLKPVVLGQSQGSEWLVDSGLNGGERVIVDGLQKVQPGSKVVPEPWKQLHPDQSDEASTPAPPVP